VAFTIVLLFGSPVVLCQFQLEESRQFSIELDTDCSAVYVYKRVFILTTDDDIAVFEQYLMEFEYKKEELLDRFTNDTLYMVNRAREITNRSMTAQDFNVSAYLLQTVTGSSGIIEYTFTWKGFAFEDEGQIQMGDVFEIGLVLLEKDELSVRYPKDYEVTHMEPDPDLVMNPERKLVWLGPKLFATGTPAVACARVRRFPLDQQIIVLTIGAAASGVGVFAFLYHRSSREKKEDELPRIPLTLLEAETDEDKVVNLLQTKGGYLPQSRVVAELGFSKSKTSEILSNMEEKGLIKRHKRGREKIVVLSRQQNR
jgi:uncharacterized membrane protein